MESIKLNLKQTLRLLTAIECTKPKLFNEITQTADKCSTVYAEFDLQGTYKLIFKSTNSNNCIQQYVSWDSTDNIHNYIMNTENRVSPCD